MRQYRAIVAIFAAGAMSAWTGHADTLATGSVFHDRDGNGQRGTDEEGLPGVAVSNGREVVRTDADGGWSLPVAVNAVLFVVKPSQWMTPLNAQQIAQSYYVHCPAGSTDMGTPGIAPTGPLPESINFPLCAREEPEVFKAVFFADTQARGLREVNFVAHDVVEELIGTDAAFGVVLGDITADGPALFPEISQALAQTGVPWYYIFGNHDHHRDAPAEPHTEAAFNRLFGPATYAFEYGPVSFIGLRNVWFEPGGKNRNGFNEDQITFVRDYLKDVPAGRLVVLMMHVPLMGCSNREKLFRLIENRPHTFSISGHVHEQFHLFLDARHGWKGASPHHHLVNATVSGSWWCGTLDETGIPHATMNDGAPNGYSVITFEGNRYRVAFKAARRPAEYQMNIYLPDDIEQAKSIETQVLVNVFAGSERSRVEMQLDAKDPWLPLEQTRGIDPECLRMHQQNDYLNEEVFGWKMDAPSQTGHLWKASLPGTLPTGTHTLRIRTTDMFGQSYAAFRVFRVH